MLLLVQQLFAIESTNVPEILSAAASLIVEALAAEKADVFLYERESQTLVAQRVSETPLGHLEQSIGMDRLQIANGGRAVAVFQTGISYRNGRVDQDPEELPGIKHGLSIRSILVVSLLVGGERRGVIQVDKTEPDAFTEQDLRFLEGVGHWTGTVMHRAELVRQVANSAAQEARRATAEELVTVLAHDFRNYLTPIRARLGLLTRRATREERQADLADLAGIATTVRRLERLITDLMDTARVTQGLFTLTKLPVDLTTLVEETAMVLQTPAVSIEVQMPTELIIWADANRLRQALENLLSNAVKHSPKETSVQVQSEIQEDGVLLSISDQGPGIPPEVLPTLFEPFRAGAGSTGLGLGLYLAYQIALAHGGQLSIDRTYSDGARFLLFLPIQEVNASDPLENLS